MSAANEERPTHNYGRKQADDYWPLRERTKETATHHQHTQTPTTTTRQQARQGCGGCPSPCGLQPTTNPNRRRERVVPRTPTPPTQPHAHHPQALSPTPPPPTTPNPYQTTHPPQQTSDMVDVCRVGGWSTSGNGRFVVESCHVGSVTGLNL